MLGFRPILAAAMLVAATASFAADDVLDAIEQARKAYQSGDMDAAKQALDLAAQLVGQKNAESFSSLLPAPLPGWNADKAQTSALGNAGFGGSTASRTYVNAKGENIEVQISGDSALISQFGPILANPQIAGAMGKIIRVGRTNAIQNADGDLTLVIANKFLVVVQGASPAEAKLGYAQAIDLDKLAKM